MRLCSLVVLVAVAMNAEGFTTKKRDSSRPAFSAVSNGAVPATAASVEHDAADQPVFAFKGMVPVQVEVVDDEIEIGYTTAFVACIASLALGFGLGYGAL